MKIRIPDARLDLMRRGQSDTCSAPVLHDADRDDAQLQHVACFGRYKVERHVGCRHETSWLSHGSEYLLILAGKSSRLAKRDSKTNLSRIDQL